MRPLSSASATRNLWDDPVHVRTRAQLAERLAVQMALKMDTSLRGSHVA